MKKVSTAKISGIPITLFFPLYARAMETGRKDANFKDSHAVRIKDAIDFDFSIFERMKGKLSFSRSDMLTGISIRTKLIDDFVTAFLKENPDGLIINLGCGLDSRFQRLDNEKITWVDMDLPEVIEIRKQFFEESGRYRMAGASILDESWVEASKAHSGRTTSG
jgi:O-methyltransferase involved in polyketide biosynthesis